MNEDIKVYDNINKLDICLNNKGKLYLISNGRKLRIDSIGIIEKMKEEN